MGKQRNTIPNEPQEMPVRKDAPEIRQPADPKVPEIPQEDPDWIPDEMPPEDPEEKTFNFCYALVAFNTAFS
jgi:hypothetical protein